MDKPQKNKVKLDSSQLNETDEIFKKEANKQITLCQDLLKSLESTLLEKEQFFKVFCEALSDLILRAVRMCNDSQLNKENKGQLLFYFKQIINELVYLDMIFNKENKIGEVLTEARRITFDQVKFCLANIYNILNLESKCLNEDNFVTWMDVAIDRVTTMSTWEIEEAHLHFKESNEFIVNVLSHAMSIAHVTFSLDAKAIRGGCQAVLRIKNMLADEIKTEDLPMIKLYFRFLNDKLSALEQKVNSAVLRTCLKTFMNLYDPLTQICSFCYSNKTDEIVLKGYIANFDLHMDRLMQIGSFALSCCSKTRALEIKSSLDILEGLGVALIPEYQSVIQNANAGARISAEFLRKHWNDQVIELQRQIFLVIDPFAFCQIIYEEMSKVFDNVSINLNKNESIVKNHVNELILMGKVLKDFLTQSRSEFNPTEYNKVEEKLNDLKMVLEEAECASKLLGLDKNIEISRVYKRFKVLLTVVKRLWDCFLEEPLNESLHELVGHTNHREKLEETLENKRDILQQTPKKETSSKGNIASTSRNLSFGRAKIKTSSVKLEGLLDDMNSLLLTFTES